MMLAPRNRSQYPPLALGSKGLAIFNACVTSPSCISWDSAASLREFREVVLAACRRWRLREAPADSYTALR